MASFLSFELTIIAIILFYKLIIYILKSTNNKTKLPPGKTGYPIIGESMSFASNPGEFIRDRMSKHSEEIFKTSIAGESIAILCGPSGNKFLFSAEDKLIKPWWPKSISKALLFESCYPSPLSEDHSFLKLYSICNYVPIMDSSTKHHLDTKWIPYNEVKVHSLVKEFTFDLSCRIFINNNNNDNNNSDEQMNTLAKPFFDVTKGIVAAPVNFPGTLFNGAVKGGAIIKENILKIIRQRKTEIINHSKSGDQDLLSRLLLDSKKNGKCYSDEDIANKIIGYLLASFYTTSAAITFVLSHLADHPHVFDKVLREHMEIAEKKEEGELLNWTDIQRMKYTWNVVCESIRLIPPAQGGLKEVLSDFSFAGFTVPKGWKAFWSFHSTNKNPKYFPNPEKFDPSRFEGNGPPPFTYVPFGAGPRMCAGKEYARIEILVFVHNVVTRFRLIKLNPNEQVIYNPEPIPLQGVPIYLQPHRS